MMKSGDDCALSFMDVQRRLTVVKRYSWAKLHLRVVTEVSLSLLAFNELTHKPAFDDGPAKARPCEELPSLIHFVGCQKRAQRFPDASQSPRRNQLGH